MGAKRVDQGERKEIKATVKRERKRFLNMPITIDEVIDDLTFLNSPNVNLLLRPFAPTQGYHRCINDAINGLQRSMRLGQRVGAMAHGYYLDMLYTTEITQQKCNNESNIAYQSLLNSEIQNIQLDDDSASIIVNQLPGGNYSNGVAIVDCNISSTFNISYEIANQMWRLPSSVISKGIIEGTNKCESIITSDAMIPVLGSQECSVDKTESNWYNYLGAYFDAHFDIDTWDNYDYNNLACDWNLVIYNQSVPVDITNDPMTVTLRPP
ncbi:36893_t:CDS:2 [Gigaspora margarita]|uniref:36893_t:CDS:1 n=1 Tax=Gigaspora margarita TaxID=4874 RepID=A0ABN7URN2_GIGMA|nr:36893_t:CDS:2 [Gigaspora margarita]